MKLALTSIICILCFVNYFATNCSI